MPDLTISSPAKVNLALGVDRPGASGMHPLASWMVVTTFADTLELDRLPDGQPATWRVSSAEDAPRRVTIDWDRDHDLAWRAADAVMRHLNRPLPVALHVSKRIPPGTGLGGGSGNAAATLVALRKLFELHDELPDDALAEIARRLGSDVSFALAGQLGTTSALVSGLGERIEPLSFPGPLHLVLMLPDLRCPTGAVYGAFDRLDQPEAVGANPQRVRELAGHDPLPPEALFNDLARPAFDVVPALADAHTRLREAMGLPIHVTGSGSALFLVAPSALTANVLARKATALTEIPALATRTR